MEIASCSIVFNWLFWQAVVLFLSLSRSGGVMAESFVRAATLEEVSSLLRLQILFWMWEEDVSRLAVQITSLIFSPGISNGNRAICGFAMYGRNHIFQKTHGFSRISVRVNRGPLKINNLTSCSVGRLERAYVIPFGSARRWSASRKVGIWKRQVASLRASRGLSGAAIAVILTITGSAS